MIPKKIFWMLGYNNLSLILDQERKHWLMKTDKKKQIQDKSGNVFQGQIDNIGSDIIIESEKMPYNYDYISELTFKTSGIDKILGVFNSAFPHSAMVNGLMFMRILSTNYPYAVDGVFQYNHYKIKFINATKCVIPFGGSTSSSEVFADKWLCTSSNPILMIMDSNGQYSIEREIMFSDNVTNPKYYYPLTDSLQPLGIVETGNGTYELDAVNDDGMIGYPLYWFTCDQTNVGSNLTFTNNMNSRNEQIFFVSNEGNATKFNAKVYTGLDGTYDATPDGTNTSNYTIRCSCKSTNKFTNTNVDFNKSIDVNSITLVNNTTNTNTKIGFVCNDNDILTMSKNIPWTYIDENTYEIEMSYFDQNCINGDRSNTPLVSIFDLQFDETVPFVKTTTDVGYAGIRLGSSLSSDVYDEYPHGMNKWDGLPEWIVNGDGQVPEHMAIYAFHQTPTYDPSDPTSLQGSGLILDAGKTKQTEIKYDDDGNPIIDNENIGRVYVISNDDIEYRNNANTDIVKPARTVARICDIPTSVMQLTGVSGLSPEPIVDKKYVRTEANYSEDDKNRLYNTIASCWVRPTALTVNGIPVNVAYGFNNSFAFPTMTNIDGTMTNTLDYVDLVNHNNFRYTENLNPKVDVTKIHIASITAPGKDYCKNDMGVCVVGGYSFTYIVNEVNDDGGVISVDIVPDDRAPLINLANFDLVDGTSGVSQPYGTSPTISNNPDASKKGTGLKFTFYIEYDYLQTILPKKGELFDKLFAFVSENDGLYVYVYRINNASSSTPKLGSWERTDCVSQFEVTSVLKSQGGVATQESFINSILPSLRPLEVSLHNNNESPTTINTLQTASFVNIIDKECTPVAPAIISNDDNTTKTVVDMCKYYCDGIHVATANGSKTVDSIIDTLKTLNVMRYDSYVIWRWLDTNSTTDRRFEYGIIHNSFNNNFTDDEVTMLPTNKLECDNYVNTNPNTTVVWNVDDVGVMMWIYDPTYTKKENYWIDAATRDLHISREEMDYNMIDIFQGISTNIPKIIDNGRFVFNVMTNNPVAVETTDMNVIYQQPKMTNIINIGDDVNSLTDKQKLFGNWKLVFPRIQSFTLKNDKTNTQWIPTKIQTIKGRGTSDIGTIYDENGHDVNSKCLVVDESTDSIAMHLFNSATGRWEII